MSHALLRITVLLLCTVGLWLPAGIAEPAPLEEAERFRVKLIGIETFYGQEKWKTRPEYQASNPANNAAQYDSALGYRITLKIQLTDEMGNNLPNDIENRNVNISAFLKTSRGNINASIQRAPGTVPGASESPIFWLSFDVDGSNVAPAGTRPPPALDPGTGIVHIDIFRRGVTGTRVEVGSDDLAFDYRRAESTIRLDGVDQRDHLVEVPENTFRLLTDIGEGSTVRFIPNQVPDSAVLRADYSFGIPDRTVRWVALTPVSCSANCVPTNGTARTEILSRVLASTRTDAVGNASFSIPVQDLLTYPGRTGALEAAVVVVAAALQPEADLPAELGAQYAKGGANIVTGADEFVLAVGKRPARVIGYTIDHRIRDGSGSAPDPIADAVSRANVLTVSVYDDAGSPCGDCGDAVAVTLGRDGKLLERATMSSMADPALASKYRQARLPVLRIQEADVSWYRVFTLFYGAGNTFQGLAFADRGYEIQTGSAPTRITDQGTFFVNVTSRNTNYDLRLSEPDFEIRVLLHVTTDNGLNHTQTLTIREGGSVSHEVPISSSRVGSLAITYEATSGDTSFGPRTTSAMFHDQPPRRGFADRIPGFEPLVLVAAVAAALVLLRRREAF